MLKKILFALFLFFVLLQFIPVELPEVQENNENDLLVNNSIPTEVADVLKTSCYDCHSNQTVYPWYSYMFPVSVQVARDVKLGRAELNFSEWESFSKKEKAKQLTEIAEEVEEGSMPYPIYLIVHKEAVLDGAKRDLIISWAEEYSESIFE